MKTARTIFAMLKADFLERTRRTAFLLTLCLVLYMGIEVNLGEILIKLDSYRGVYNSAWVGSLMALVITFFLGLIGFYLVKDAIRRDERSGVGQIIASTPLTRAQYLLGKWLSNFSLLASLVALLAVMAVLMQVFHQEEAQLQAWALLAPLLFIALPMMALVAALAVFFETIPGLKGGFGNLVYFGVFLGLVMVGVFLPQYPWLDVVGLSLVGENMKAAAGAAFPAYQGTFTLAMISDKPLQTFVWNGLDWTPGLIAMRLLWLAAALSVVLLGSLFFDRFDPRRGAVRQRMPQKTAPIETRATADALKVTQLTPLKDGQSFHNNFLRLVWLECKLLLKGVRWYWLAGFGAAWLGCVLAPAESYRKYFFMLACLAPVLIWSRMGEREARYQTEQLIYQAAYPLGRTLLSSWLAGVALTALAASGVLLGRLLSGEPLAVLSWVLSVVFIPTLALTLGVWSRSSQMFEVIYPILWYLGPFKRGDGMAVLDYLGIHAIAPVNNAPLLFAGVIGLLLALAFLGRQRRLMA